MLSRCMLSRVKHNSYFLAGLLLGLWVSLAVIPLEEPEPTACAGASASVFTDEFEPRREERPFSPGGQAAGRTVQRPRYYSTELGMRGSLLCGVLSSEEALKNQVVALNKTAAKLQPALKIFITASVMSSVPGLANVVGFTDTREMLKPFHALKYLGDNYLEEYDFFFLVSDNAYVNARRLSELVSQLSVSQDVYMGVVADDESQYCSLDSGIILSNSVLRAIHGELDWCVRNSYSPHHHENIGRCVLHAAHASCTNTLQGEQYRGVRVPPDAGALQLEPRLSEAVTVHALDQPHRFYQLHAYISRVYLERDRDEVTRLRAYMWRNSVRHPVQYRNSTWPAGLRDEPGLSRPLPTTRFDHVRWTRFNTTHVFMPDDHRVVTTLRGAHRQALDAVMRTTRAWSMQRWRDAIDVQLVEGSWLWEPAVALRYRLLLRLRARHSPTEHTLRWVEVVRGLGAARLVPVRYVTESEHITVILPVPVHQRAVTDALQFLRHYDAVCLAQDKNTALIVVLVQPELSENTTISDTVADIVKELRDDVTTLTHRFTNAQIDVIEATSTHAGQPPHTEQELLRQASDIALDAALSKVSRDALLLLAAPHAEFNEDFLNRVRMNSIMGEQWYLPVPFSRHSQYSHPKFLTPAGVKPQVNTGRFNLHHHQVLAFYRADYDAAVSEWSGTGAGAGASPADLLTHSALRCIRAPEPGLVLSPRSHPCLPPLHEAPPTPPDEECARELRVGAGLVEDTLYSLDLGAKHSLAQLLLETQAELDN